MAISNTSKSAEKKRAIERWENEGGMVSTPLRNRTSSMSHSIRNWKWGRNKPLLVSPPGQAGVDVARYPELTSGERS